MPFSSLNFLSLDEPPTLMCNPMPNSHGMPDKFEWSRFLPAPKKMNDPMLSPAEVEEANIFVDAVLGDGDSESKAASTNAEMKASSQDKGLIISKNRMQRKNNMITTSKEIVAREPTSVPEKFDLAFMEGTTATESGEGLPAVPIRVAVDGVVVPRPKDLPQDWFVVVKMRKSGKTAGHKDKYYIQGKTGRKLRSMKRVRHFLETGCATIRKPRKKVGEGNSRASDDDQSKLGKGPLEEGDNGEVERQMPASVLP